MHLWSQATHYVGHDSLVTMKSKGKRAAPTRSMFEGEVQ